MISLKIIESKLIKYFVFIFFFVFYFEEVLSKENKIIFKINDIAYTSLDYEMRVRYLDFVGSNNNLTKDIIIKDYISANLFYEHSRNLNDKNNYDAKINEIFNKIKKINEENNKEYKYEIDKSNILQNIKIDLIRKSILEKILNDNFSNFSKSLEELDLLYKFNLKYINFESTKNDSINLIINNNKNIDFSKAISILEENKINFFTKNQEIDNIKTINKIIRNNILINNKYFVIKKGKETSLVFIEKNFETFDGIIVNLYSIKSKIDLEKDYLQCKNLIKLIDNANIVNKEYNLSDLNMQLKDNLVSIDDYIKLNSNNENVYVVLCDIKFNREILDNININKLISSNVIKFEEEFINEYSKKYKLIIFND